MQPPPHLPVPSNIVDQKQIVLHVTLRDPNVLFMFHLQTDARIIQLFVCLEGPKSIPAGRVGGS